MHSFVFISLILTSNILHLYFLSSIYFTFKIFIYCYACFLLFFFLHFIGVDAADGNGFGYVVGPVSYQHGQYKAVKRPMLAPTAYAQDLVGPDIMGVSNQHQHPRAYVNVTGSTSGKPRPGGAFTMTRSTDQESSSIGVSSFPTAQMHSSPYSPYAQTNNSNSTRDAKNHTYLPGMLLISLQFMFIGGKKRSLMFSDPSDKHFKQIFYWVPKILN